MADDVVEEKPEIVLPYREFPSSWHTAADGWVPVVDMQTKVILYKTSKVNIERSILTQDIICEKWVLDAIALYNKEGGFADMALFQYLDKMAGEREPAPKHTF
jgi:hypothetical protein